MHLMKKIRKLALRDYVTNHARVYRRFGSIWLLRYRNHIDRKIILGERYEDAQLKFCEQLIAANEVSCFVDIGANIGLYSVTLAASAPTLSSVFAFEPDRRNFNHLAANIYLNDLDRRIDARPIGLSQEKKSVRFLSNKGNSTGMSRIAETAPASTDAGRFEETVIEVDTLDSQLGSVRGQVVYLKIDVEGHEKSVIEGGRSFFAQNRCFLQMEILNNQAPVLAWMQEEIGFTCLHHIDNDYFFNKTA
jgi:FkbM family methyltransferase